jgi:hypothetical protein
LLFELRKKGRRFPAGTLVNMLRNGKHPTTADDAYWTGWAEAWRWVEMQQKEWLADMAPRVGLSHYDLEDATNFDNLPGGFRFLTRGEFIKKILASHPSQAPATLLTQTLAELHRIERGAVLRDPRVAEFAALVTCPHETLPGAEDFRFDENGLRNLMAFHPQCARAHLRALYLADLHAVDHILDSPALRLALEADDGALQAAINGRLDGLSLKRLAEIHRENPDWVSRERVAARVREHEGVVPVDLLPAFVDGVLVDRAATSSVEELVLLVPRLARDGADRPRLVRTLLTRFGSSWDVRIARILGSLLDTRSSWEQERGVELLLPLARARRFDLMKAFTLGAHLAAAPSNTAVGRGSPAVVVAIHLALASALLRWAEELLVAGDATEVERVLGAIALLDPSPPFTRLLRKFERHPQLGETARHWVQRLHMMLRNEGGTEATPDGIRDCIEELESPADG